MTRARKLVLLAAGLVAVAITAVAFLVDSWAHQNPAPSAPTTTTSATTLTPASSPISTTPTSPPSTAAPKRPGHGHHKGDGGD